MEQVIAALQDHNTLINDHWALLTETYGTFVTFSKEHLRRLRKPTPNTALLMTLMDHIENLQRSSLAQQRQLLVVLQRLHGHVLTAATKPAAVKLKKRSKCR
jgi:hypothetical protein